MESLRAVVDRMRREQDARRARAAERHAAIDAAFADLTARVGILERDLALHKAALADQTTAMAAHAAAPPSVAHKGK